MATRQNLAKQLDELDAAIDDMKKMHPDPSEFWPEFAGMADVILDQASAEDYDWVNARTDEILAKHHLAIPPQVPSEDVR
ncbi:hypothetical protein RKE25_22820 (plasmid) [Dyella sp. BiH032]|uniref:hypothetical protein n=1 Tax=Dyella sp. BiH032 TaxID=3075430 RepID=UPI0028937611|nr:hypothetical protein [Dyella sp. BiH032]WNL48369.1 hypothetical protein RKE25_22820 [Dyella sp. BiH032]